MVSQPQTVRTFHPSSRSCFVTSWSRRLFFPIFCFQNRTLEEGRCPREQECPCQKHPLTNTTLRLEGNTRSGVPVKSFRCSLKRYPSRWSIDRIKSSGPVSRPRMRDIMRLRCSGGNMSIDVGTFGVGQGLTLPEYRLSIKRKRNLLSPPPCFSSPKRISSNQGSGYARYTYQRSPPVRPTHLVP